MELTANNSLLTGTNKAAGISLQDGQLLHKRAERPRHKMSERHREVQDEIYTHTTSQIGNAASLLIFRKESVERKKKVLQHTFSLWSSRRVCQEPCRALAPHQNV